MRFLLVLILSLLSLLLWGQKEHSIYLIGNTASSESTHALIQHLDGLLSTKHQNSILFLGDITDENGFSKKPGKENHDLMDHYFSLEGKKDKCYFIAGDRDWDGGGPKGINKVKDLENYIVKKTKRKSSFIPKNGCLGPDIVKLKDDILLVAINTQWFIHEYDKPRAPDTDCSNISEPEFWEDLEDIIDDYSEKTIILMGHHPVVSTGKRFGHQWNKWHWLPIIGNAFVSFKKNIGNDQDFANPRYRSFAHKMQELLHEHENIIYASSHENHSEVLKLDDNFHINVSAADKPHSFSQSSHSILSSHFPSFARIDVHNKKIKVSFYSLENGQVTQSDKTTLYKKKKRQKHEDHQFRLDSTLYTGDSVVIAGIQYKAGKLRTKFMGSQYRNVWTTPVKAPYFNFAANGENLVPYARGGGLQTNSLKFKSPSGRKYAYRSVNKNTDRALSPLIRKTIYKDISQDIISSQHPYGSLVVDRYMNQLGIRHASPKLYVMPNTPNLEGYQEMFGGIPGLMEEKPKSKVKTFGADQILQSNQMFRNMYRSNKHRLDKKSYALARVFDMWVGDWDRHEDNWIWAMYKEDQKSVYYPIPKDRDHVFSRWTGIIPSIADKIIMNAEHFGPVLKNITHLNFKARHLDRQMANELTLDDWEEAVDFLITKMDDKSIDDAFEAWPKEIQELDADIIKSQLKTRRADLLRGVTEHYATLAKEVNIIASNQKDHIEITRAENGNVNVVMKNKNYESYYSRQFKHEETEWINIYALSGKDEIAISGECKEDCIKIRIMGGDQKDKIFDSSVISKGKANFIYQEEDKLDYVESAGYTTVKMPREYPIYDNKEFMYDATLILPGLRKSSGNGTGISLSYQRIFHGFNKPNWKSKFNVKGLYFPSIKAQRLSASYEYHNIYPSTDFEIEFEISDRNDQFPFFYGLGGNSERDIEKFDDGFYRIDFDVFHFNMEFTKTFLRKSTFSYGICHHINGIDDYENDAGTPLLALENQEQFLDEQYFTAINADWNFDFRDKANFTRDGTLISQQNKLFKHWTNSTFSLHNVSFTQYQSLYLPSPITFVLRGAASTTIGNTPFYYRSALGSNTYLRGYTRNRFIDTHALAFNSEARFHLGTFHNVLAPINYGFFIFYDTGKVWGEESFSTESWHDTAGGGIYLSPLNDLYSLTLFTAVSEDKGLYLDFRLGWRI